MEQSAKAVPEVADGQDGNSEFSERQRAKERFAEHS